MAPTILRKLARASRSFEFTFRYLYNFTPTLAYKFGRRSLSGEATRVLEDLNRDGVAMTSAGALLGPSSCFNELDEAVDKLKHDLADQLAAGRAAAHGRDAPSREENFEKVFLFPLLGDRPVLDANDIHVRFALQKPILRIANAYFGMYGRLRYYNVWHNFPTQSQARASQLWHRDYDDLHYLLKVFVCLSDVDDGAGPFTYAAGSHSKGKLRREPAYLYKEGATTRSDDGQMAEVVPPERWVKGVGPKGTMIFADTRGYHKGGLAREHDRTMYACMFTSPLALELFDRPGDFSLPPDKEQASALIAPKRGAEISSRSKRGGLRPDA